MFGILKDLHLSFRFSREDPSIIRARLFGYVKGIVAYEVGSTAEYQCSSRILARTQSDNFVQAFPRLHILYPSLDAECSAIQVFDSYYFMVSKWFIIDLVAGLPRESGWQENCFGEMGELVDQGYKKEI